MSHPTDKWHADAPTDIVLTPWMLAKLLCTVQGNDHYDTDYAPCFGCREMAEEIVGKEAEGV